MVNGLQLGVYYAWQVLKLKTLNEALSIIARLSVNYKNKKEENSLELSSFVQSCKFVTDYRTFMKDFLKVVDFVHYLKAEGYDMVTFDKVGNGIKQ